MHVADPSLILPGGSEPAPSQSGCLKLKKGPAAGWSSAAGPRMWGVLLRSRHSERQRLEGEGAILREHLAVAEEVQEGGLAGPALLVGAKGSGRRVGHAQ